MICYDCRGKGFTLFCGNESACKPCGTTGQLEVCANYTMNPNGLVAFRNQPCHNCGVKENDHFVVVIVEA